jgi:hypothetical protein
MTQENKELLFKDLCARLPYGVVLQLTLWEEKTTDCRLTGIDEDGNLTADVPADCAFSIEGIKPYLRPMSSMTEEEKLMYEGLMIGTDNVSYMLDVIDWLNAHHFDYRGLIEKGLALEAPKDMYNIK